MRRKLLVFLLVFGFMRPVIAQQSHIDSLLAKLPAMKDDTNKLNVLERIAIYYRDDAPDKGIAYAQQTLNLATALKNIKGICTAYGCMVESNTTKGDFKTAIELNKKEYAIAQEYGSKHYMATATSNLGLAYEMQGDYGNAQNYFFKCLQIAEENKDTHLQEVAALNISVVYLNQEDFDKTRFYIQKTLDIVQKTKVGEANIKGKAYELMGTSYGGQKRFALAQKYYNLALDVYQTQKLDVGIATIYSLITSTYPKDYAKQLEYGIKAEALWDKLAPKNLYAINNLGNIGIAYGDMARQRIRTGEPATSPVNKNLLQKSDSYISRAIVLARETDSKQNIVELTDSLATVNALIGNFPAAYYNLREHNRVADTLFSQDSKNKIAALEGKHEIELRDKQLLINKLELAGRRRQLYFLLTGLFTLLIIAGLIYAQSLQRKKTNLALKQLNDQLDEANKTKTRFFNILNHDLRAPVSSFLNFLHLQQKAPDLVSDDLRAGYSAKMTESAEHLLNTMEDLLLWSKGQMENFKPQITQVKTDDLFAYLRQIFERATGIQFVFENETDVIIETDEHYLKTIMHNLTSNAVKALANTPNGSVTWKAWEKDNVRYLSITDNGPGATSEDLQALYDDSVPIGIKNGLGLHIVRDMAKAINCQISIDTKQKQGICISLRFQ